MTREADRYHRQGLLPDWGEAAQVRLVHAHAVVVGVGALGCVSADLLVRAGVGRLTLVDRDVVERTNLQRQVLFDERDAVEGVPKAEAARRRLAAVNSTVRIDAVVADFTHENAERIAAGADADPPDILLDGTDNFETRYLLNDFAVKYRVPYVYAGAVAERGVVLPVLPDGRRGGGEPGPCLRCVFPDMPTPGTEPTCETVGVLGPLISVVAGWQAALALRILTGRGELTPQMIEFDLATFTLRRIDLSNARDDACVGCVKHRFEFLNGQHGDGPTALCGREAVQVSGGAAESCLDLDALAGRLKPHGRFGVTRFLLKGRLDSEGVALTVFRDGRAIVEGTADVARARGIYARYVGA